jgi:hypothetical protein
MFHALPSFPNQQFQRFDASWTHRYVTKTYNLFSFFFPGLSSHGFAIAASVFQTSSIRNRH